MTYSRLGLLLFFFYISTALARDIAFPLRLAPNGHYLEDNGGRPFLMTGDRAWSLIADLSASDAELYLQKRQQQGFNTILTSLIEHKFARRAPENFYREAPFLAPGDFASPNDRYFDRAEDVIRAAARRNLLVLLTPAYLGAGGGPEGWYAEMVAAGPEKLKAYGRYLGERFGHFSNIIWVQGGDYDPPDRALVGAIAEGIAERAPGAFQTVHANRDTISSSYWEGANWLDLDTVYTYGDVAAAVRTRYASGPGRPFFFIEGKYESEHGVRESEVRLIAYSALLSGASGQIYGNNPVWHFSAPGLQDAPDTWKRAVSSRGAASITHLVKLFDTLAWWLIAPDQAEVLKAVDGGDGLQAIAGRATDGSFALVYLDNATSVTIDLSSLAPGSKSVRWYDPSKGRFIGAPTAMEGAATENIPVPAEPNASGFHDWVAVISTGG